MDLQEIYNALTYWPLIAIVLVIAIMLYLEWGGRKRK